MALRSCCVCCWAAAVLLSGHVQLSASQSLDSVPSCTEDAHTSFLQAQVSLRKFHLASWSDTQASVFASTLGLQTPMDPPGAPCVNCDQNGAYRQPGRDNCTVIDNERAMVQHATEGLKLNPFDTSITESNEGFVLMALVCSDYLIEHGGLDAIFGVITHAYQMPPQISKNERNWFEFRGWQALSDQSNSKKAAPFIANYGGTNKGIELMVNALKAHQEPLELKSTPFEPGRFGINRLTLRYEISVNIMGILKNDNTGEWGDAAVDAGFLEEAMHTLHVESDHCSPLFSTCASLNYLLLQNPHRDRYKTRLLQLGAPELARKSAEYCTPYKPNGDDAFMAGMNWGQIHPADQAYGKLALLLQ
eukprot:TRINITY_DN16708_c0_g1_i1.p1 TRINITY_DN16708_c0_g1~~TRINITY_DN16708_c0_g1_i1.p1  ORF type:complete len:374 (-),score=46.52 TRINITY_DN16708_c0_g1_i1:62-1147(-)